MTVVANDLSSLEYAKAFAGLGTKVTLVVENKASFDKACADAKVGADSAAAIVKSLEGMGVSVSYDDSVSSADSSSDPRAALSRSSSCWARPCRPTHSLLGKRSWASTD